jgi:hypothetical protein
MSKTALRSKISTPDARKRLTAIVLVLVLQEASSLSTAVLVRLFQRVACVQHWLGRCLSVGVFVMCFRVMQSLLGYRMA